MANELAPLDGTEPLLAPEVRAIEAGERSAALAIEQLRAELKAPLAEFYKRLARHSLALQDGSEERTELAALIAEVEALDARLDRALGQNAASVREVAKARSGPRSEILLVDDDADSRECFARLLEPHFALRVACDGIEGARMIRERPPDAVITDLCMPRVDGYALLSTLRASDEAKHVPVLVLSGMSDTEAKVRAFDAGAFDYLTKPVAPGEVVARIRNALAHAEALRRQRELQGTDDLTGLANRRWLRTFLAGALKSAARTRREMSVVMIDQDHLKRINDVHGHAAGDAAIKILAHALSSVKRASDCAARTGGDEFVVVLPETDRTGAEAFVRRVKDFLEGAPVVLERGSTLRVSASFGIACSADVAWEESCEQILERADEALYAAKRARPDLLRVG